MQNSVVIFTLPFFRPEIPFLGKFGPGYENCQIKLKSGINTNLNMQNSVVVFSFSIFDRKYPFWSNLAQKVLVGFLGVRFEVGGGGGGRKLPPLS